MIEPSSGPAPVLEDDDEISLLALGSVLLRWRRTIIALGLLGAAVGLATGLTSTRVYVSAATFIPQGSEGGFGARPRREPVRHPRAYERRRVALMDLLEVEAPTPARRTDLGVRALGKIVTASEEKKLGAVKLSATTRWPSVSLAVAGRLVRGVNQFNLETRKSQAAAERQFVEVQAGEAERALRGAENRLQSFLQRNAGIAGLPELAFEHDRLQRDVALRQQVYTSLLVNQEEARIREVRDTPVITVLEDLRLPVVPEARRALLKGIMGGVAGGMLGVLIAFLAQGVVGARRQPSDDAREFFQLVEEATPRFLRRR